MKRAIDHTRALVLVNASGKPNTGTDVCGVLYDRLVIDGGCRDVDFILREEFPVFARYTTRRSVETG